MKMKMPLEKQIGEHHWEYASYMVNLFAKTNNIQNGFRYLVSVDNKWLHALEYHSGSWIRRTDYHNLSVEEILNLYRQLFPQNDNPIFRNNLF